MIYDLTDTMCYFIDKGIYEKKMAIENMIFMLSKHLNDETFLESNLFNKLHEKTIEKTAEQWCREMELVEMFVPESITYYKFDLSKKQLIVEK